MLMNFIKNKTYINFILYFIFYGVVIAVITSIVSYKLQFSNTKDKITKDAKLTASYQIDEIKNNIQGIERNLYSIIQNPIFRKYLENQNNDTETLATELFLYTAMSNPNFFQIRYIDTLGKEKIRIDKDRFSNNPLIIRGENLQDKSKRYYFQEAVTHTEGTYWRSNIDLNMEHNKLEKPFRPTFRVATPIYHKEKLFGIVIINVDLTKLFNSIQKNTEFNLYIIDKNGYYLLHPNPKYLWSKYTKSKHTLKNDFPNKASQIVDNENYQSSYLNSFSLEKIVQNNEKLMLILKTNDNYVSQLKNNNYTLTLYLAILILFISVPLGIILSITPAKLQDKLNRLLKENTEQLEIIDKAVITSTTDLDGKITNISTAMSKVCGYSKEELINQTHSIMQSGKVKNETYQNLWETIKKEMVWTGEIQNKTKDGQYFWLDMSIIPHYNSLHILDGYIAISSNATDKKTMEYISEHDKLTSLCNRVRLDFILEKEFYKKHRYHHLLSIILIDIDHFKKINDTYGHLIGDDVLISIADILQSSSRKTDTIGRWGGEEFLIICPNTKIEGATKLAETIRTSIEKHSFETVGNVTISAGVTELEITDNIKSALKRCDDNLYKAKTSGRNCVKSFKK